MAIYFSGEEIVEMGINIEEMGEKFYTSYISETKNEKVKDLFKFLANEEAKHKQVFQNILDSLHKGEFVISYSDEEVSKYFEAIVDARVFSDEGYAIQLAKTAKDEIEALRFAISFEKDTIVFYYGFLDLVKEKTKDIIMKLINEEKKHLKLLHDIKIAVEE
jgi:rubrerythrin